MRGVHEHELVCPQRGHERSCRWDAYEIDNVGRIGEGKRDGRRRTVNRFVDARTVEVGNVSPGVLGKVLKRFLQGSRLV